MSSKPMTCDELEALVKAADPRPWLWASNPDERLLQALHDEAPHLLAIWRAAEEVVRLSGVSQRCECGAHYEKRVVVVEHKSGCLIERAMTALRAALAGEVKS